MNDVANLLLIAVTGGLWFYFRPFYVYRVAAFQRGALDSFFIAFSFAVLQMILSVYLLLFVRLLYAWSLVVLFLVEDLLIARLRYGTGLWSGFRAVFAFFSHFRKGYIAPRIIRMNIGAWFSKRMRGLAGWFRLRWFPLLILIAGLSYGMYVRMAPVLSHMAYGVTDLYVYTEWIKNSLQNIVFCKGVYFYGMHNVIAGYTLLFGFDAAMLLRLTGVFNGLLMLLAAYWLITSFFQNRLIPALCIAAACVLETMSPGGRLRQSYMLAQEFSQLFMLISAGFFMRYLHKPSRSMLFFFSLTLTVTVSSHYYGVIALALFCIALAVTHVDWLFRDRAKRFRELAVAVAIAMVVGVGPMVVGLLMGKPLEASFGWGLSVMGQGTAAFAEKAEPLIDKIEALGYPLKLLYSLAAALAASGFTALLFIFRHKAYPHAWRRMLGMVLYSALMLLMLLAKPLGLPSLMDHNRSMMFFAITGTILYFLPLEWACALPMRAWQGIAVGAMSCALGYLAIQMPFCEPVYTNTAQHDGAVRVYYDIVQNHPSGQWTIVSPVEEMSLCMGKGYHYELYQFIDKQEDFNWDRMLEIPTRYVFFYVEKVPLNYERIENTRAVLPYPITEAEAAQPIYKASANQGRGDTAYIRYEYRRVLESKMYYWAEAFQRAFPQDMELYYEDDFMRVYKYTQNMFQLTNFAIPYTYNGIQAVV